jgi:hypothetical protein
VYSWVVICAAKLLSARPKIPGQHEAVSRDFSGDLGPLLVLREANAVWAEAAISATRSFYPQLAFLPRTINNF